MFFNRLKRKFRVRRRTNDGDPIPVFWVGDDEEATLVNLDSGRMHAYVRHDGCGKYYPTVIVSPWRALYLIRLERAVLVSLLSFPRCTIEMFRLKTDMREAREIAEFGLGYRE
jgi:hypothetical protein